MSDILYRMTMPIQAQSTNNLTNLDRMIMNWHRQNPGKDARYPTLPSRWELKRGSWEHRMTEEEKALYLKLRGEYVVKRLENRNLNFDNPGEREMDLLDRTLRAASTQAGDKMARDIRMRLRREQR